MKKKIFLILTVLVVVVTVGKGQITLKTKRVEQARADSDIMLHPDANTAYFDEAGKKIAVKDFEKFLRTGQYSIMPVMENGKIKSVQLKKGGVSQVKPGNPAPDFMLTDINGNKIALKELKGKTVVLNFWFTTCAPCIMEMPGLNSLVEKYKNDSNIVFLAVTNDSTEKVKSFLSGKEFKFSIAAGQVGLINRYGVNSYPTSMVIDKTGVIAFVLAAYDGTNLSQLDGVIRSLKVQ